jgi:hypothetical protein
MSCGVPYCDIQDVLIPLSPGTRTSYCLVLNIPSSGSLLLQTSNAYTRDQWYHSLIWKITSGRFRHLFQKISKPEELIAELKDLVAFCLSTPISDQIIYQLPLNTVSSILLHHSHQVQDTLKAFLIKIITPILEFTSLTPAICKSYQRISKNHPDADVNTAFLSSVQRILKHNTEFGKFHYLRMFVQEYLCTVYRVRKSYEDIQLVVASLHSSNTVCPHQRVLPNLVTVSLAAFYSVYDEESDMKEEERSNLLTCFKWVFNVICTYKDWLPMLAILLQAVPFPVIPPLMLNT